MNGEAAGEEVAEILVVIREAQRRLDAAEAEIARVDEALASSATARAEILALMTSMYSTVALLANDMAWVKSTFEREKRPGDHSGYSVATRALIVVGIALAIVAGVLGVRLPGWLGGDAPSVSASAPTIYPRSDLRYEYGPE